MVFVAGNEAAGDDYAGYFLRAEFHFDAGSLELIDDGAERLGVADFKWEIAELMFDGDAGIVAESGNLAALIDDGERFQDIVHLAGFEVEAGGLAWFELALPLEITDTVLIEDNGTDRQFRRRQ